MNPALSQEFNLFCEQEQLQKHETLDKSPYCVYSTLENNIKYDSVRPLGFVEFKVHI